MCALNVPCYLYVRTDPYDRIHSTGSLGALYTCTVEFLLSEHSMRNNSVHESILEYLFSSSSVSIHTTNLLYHREDVGIIEFIA